MVACRLFGKVHSQIKIALHDRDLHQDKESPEHLALKTSRAGVQELHRTGRKRNSTLRVHTRCHVHWDPSQSSSSIGTWARPNYGFWSPKEVGVG